ncbi:DUF2092 domain-containing protein [bacterium]|nr:DUF2092 domain-containing protein [bacterium]
MKIPFLALGTALLVSSCASRYTISPPDAGVSPNPDVLLKSMSTRLASTKQYRFTADRKIPADQAKAKNQDPTAHVEVVVARPDKLAVKISEGKAHREMLFDGSSFVVVDGANNFYSKALLNGSLDKVPVHLAKVYGFQPPLAEFIISDPYRDLKHRVTGVSYLGKGTVRESGGVVQCHRIGMHGSHADAELWLGVADSLPRRLKATKTGSAGKDLLMDVDFLTWEMNHQASASAFRYQPVSGATEIPMVTLEEANQPR